MLDRVGDEHAAPVDAGIVESTVEDVAARPTNGLPAMSSRSPGCSPTSINSAPIFPSPGTIWVASR
jgi:hypothetical protein